MLVCFTGKMNLTRNDETERFNKMGIDVKNSVTKKTDFLVTGYDVGQTKITKAEKYNIPVLRENEFFEMLREEFPEFYL